MYQEAIAKNYSHEQMTPLNFIINGCIIIKEQSCDLINHLNIDDQF